MHRAVESEDASETEALLSAAEQGQAGPGKFFYFTTFVQAALIVHELRLLDLASVRQVSHTWVLACLISQQNLHNCNEPWCTLTWLQTHIVHIACCSRGSAG